MVMKLFYDFIDKYDWMILFCIFEVIDFDEVIGGNNFVILIDGLFDLDSVFFEYKKEWIEKFQWFVFVLQVNKRNNYVIIIMFEDSYGYLLNCFFKSKFFQFVLIDISYGDYNLIFEEKKLFFNMYVVFFFILDNIQGVDLINFVLLFGFLKCCEILYNNCFFYKDFLCFF